MKKILIISIMLLSVILLTAQENPINDYYSNQTAQTFSAAWNYCTDQLAKDSTLVDMKILMANMAVLESKRIARELYPEVNKLAVGQKFMYGNLLLAQNKFGEAAEIYETINQEYSNWSCPWRHKGEALYRLERYKDAEKSIEKAIETNLEHYDAYIWMAKIQYKLKKYKPALKNLEYALTLNPESEESPDEVLTEDSIRALHEELLYKTGNKK